MRMCTKTQALELQNKNKEAVLLFGIFFSFFKGSYVYVERAHAIKKLETGSSQHMAEMKYNIANFQITGTV